MLKAGPLGLGGKGVAVGEEAEDLLHPQCHSLGVPWPAMPPGHGSPQRDGTARNGGAVPPTLGAPKSSSKGLDATR